MSDKQSSGLCLQGDEKAQKKFQEVSEAYDTLKDSSKRSVYDRVGPEAMDNMDGFDGSQGFGGFGVSPHSIRCSMLTACCHS